jgi:hypothetical protein
MRPTMSPLFDYWSLAARIGVRAEDLGELERLVGGQYGRDEMLVELRMVRTLRAIEAGTLTVAEAIAEFQADPGATNATHDARAVG